MSFPHVFSGNPENNKNRNLYFYAKDYFSKTQESIEQKEIPLPLDYSKYPDQAILLSLLKLKNHYVTSQ
jgi:hypothetical protein